MPTPGREARGAGDVHGHERLRVCGVDPDHLVGWGTGPGLDPWLGGPAGTHPKA